jgi:hypothetical protein
MTYGILLHICIPFSGTIASTTTEKRNLTVDRGQVIQNNTSNLMS